MSRKLAQVAFFFGLILVVCLSLLPAEVLVVEVNTWDKLNHAAAYATLAFVGGLGIRRGRPMLFVMLALLILGGGLEVAQAAVPNRSPSAYDALANLFGIVLGTLLAIGTDAARGRWTRAARSRGSHG